MDEKTTTQYMDDQDEAVDMPVAEDEEDFEFDMNAAMDEASQIYEKQQQEEMDLMSDEESFAAKFSEKWVLALPKNSQKIIDAQLAKKARRA